MKQRRLAVGKKDVKLTAPSHVAGIPQGNCPTRREQKRSGLRFSDGIATATARRSTGVACEDREPIDPRMPHLPPS